ncbi:MAG: hypothetical protein HRT61_15630, partial [Ekhidna sp.]|nr:hypothetical protein [Ekhidna sp.]
KDYPLLPWIMAAACTLLFVLFPISFLEKSTQDISLSEVVEETKKDSPLMEVMPASNIGKKLEMIPVKTIKSIERRNVNVALASVDIKPLLEPLLQPKAEEKPQFAPEDISIIQASLERPSIRKGRTMTIRAQWQKSSTNSNVENQALKIKLYEKNK